MISRRRSGLRRGAATVFAAFAAGLLIASSAGAWRSPPQQPRGDPLNVGRDPTVMACAVGIEGWKFSGHPHSCNEYRGSVRYELAGTFLRHLRWRGWGNRHAVGHGKWKFCGAGGCDGGAASLRAFDRTVACGRRVYDRLRVDLTVPGRSNYKQVYRLPRC